MTPSLEVGASGGHRLVQTFREIADDHPHRPAIVHNGRVVTYSELRTLVSEQAERVGARPGVVGVAVAHSPGTVAALFGVWAAGGAYCPVDPAFPEERRRVMLAAAGCRVLLDTAGTGDAEIVERPRADVPRPETVARPQAGVPEPETDERNDRPGGAASGGLAYVLFTSGSTGEPKPVMTSARAIEATVGSLRDLFALTTGDRVLQFASLNWDTCFEEILPTLTSGACLVFHDDAHKGSFPRFLRMVENEHVTVLNLPTAFWHELVNHLTEEGASLPAHVRLVIIGGEAAAPARLADWRALDTGRIRLLNTYGCTETTLITHAVDLHGPPAHDFDPPAGRLGGEADAALTRHEGPVPIGRALPHVVERVGDDGELLIGGPAIADGYLGLPEATAAKFVTIDGRRFFRTGDRVGRTPGGLLVHRGRIDGELKVRGIRVDPAEVEAHIAGHPMVGAVAVTGVEVADHTVLAAYVVPRSPDGADGLGAAVLGYLRGRVPAHLVPSRVSIVADLVYTPSGKVDRRRIKETFN